MSTSETITKTDLKNILEAAGNIGQVDSTPTPTAGKVSEFDAAANINSTDMSASELTNFLENLDPHGSGGGSGTPIPTANTTAAFDSNANMNSSDMTTAQVDTLVGNITAAGGSLIDFFYPVGSYYETSDTTFNPNIRWGGTWSKVTEGYFLQATETAADVGNTVSAGLPNITGEYTQRSTNYNASNITWASGLFTMSDYSGQKADGVTQANGSINTKKMVFDASKANSIYGNSTTVQPPAILVYIWHRTA